MNAFWSLTMYDLPQQLLVEEPDQPLPDQLADAARPEEAIDGGLTIYIQARLAGQGQGVQLAARAERTVHDGDAVLLAEAGAAERTSGSRHR